MRRAHVPCFAIAALTALPACDGCHAKKPYTPYTLTDAPPASSSAAPVQSAAADDGGAPFTAIPATPAPGDGASWPLEGGAVTPPTGHTFAHGITIDMDGDGKPDLLAWSRAPDGLRGELWFASGKSPGEGRMIAALPADLSAPGCTGNATLSQIGPRTAAFDFDPKCPARSRDRAARWIAMVRLQAAPEIALDLRIGATAEGESLQVALDGRDRDGDGRGDVAIAFTLNGAPRPLPSGGSATAQVAFFDRPAGLSRDPTEPDASFKALGAGLVADGRKKTTAPRIPLSALAARRLHALLCDVSRTTVTTSAGPIRCGDLRIAEESTIAEIEALLNLGDAPAAFAALARLDAMGPRRKDVDALVARAVPVIPGTLAHTTAAIADAEAPPSFAPIAFDAGGDLLVRTRERVVRVERGSFTETPFEPPPAWAKRIAWPGDTPQWTLTAVEERCDAPTLMGRFDAGGESTSVPLPIATSPRCSPSANLRVDPLGNSSQGLLFSVRGDIVAVPLAAPPRPVAVESYAASGAIDRGAARSPNGGTIAVSTARGVVVAVLKGTARSTNAKLWTAPLIDGATTCVPSDGGDRLACVVGKGVAIYDAK